MKTKRFITGLLAVVMVCAILMMTACSNEQNAPVQESKPAATNAPDTQNTPTGYTIAVSLNDADEFRTSWLNAFTAVAEAKGHTVISTNAGSDAAKQIADIESLMVQKPDLVVIHAYSADGIVPALDTLDQAGIPVVLYDFPVNSDKYAARIADGQDLNGIIQAQYVKQWLAEDPSRVANVGYIVGMYAVEAVMPRRDGFYQELGITEPMAEQEGGWTADNAMKIAEDWLQAYPEMNVFCCMSDDMAIGVIQALTAAGKNMDDVLVLGIDGTDAAKEYLRSGELDCTAAVNLDTCVQVTLDTCEKILAGEEVAKEIEPMGISAMTKENID